MNQDAEITRHDAVLLSLVAVLQDGGMRQLGKLVDPLSGKPERDLDGARATIDILEMLQAKCRAGTPAPVMRALDAALFDLRMNWLDESRRETAEAAAPAAPDSASAADAGPPREAPA